EYWVAEDNGGIIAAIGLELGDVTAALLRSAIVEPSHRNLGLGRILTEEALDWAQLEGFTAVYCFSTDAGSYWTARGFVPCTVEEVLRAIPNAPQVRLFDRLGWLPTEVAYARTLTPRLATYGTLSPGRVHHHELAGLNGAWRPGMVRGHLVGVSTEGFPALMLDPFGPVVEVHLFESPDLPAHWKRLDEFEGPEYRRVLTNVSTSDGSPVKACIYVCAGINPQKSS
ncbi:MAG TPA: GNAT family N-acetyltransferase, partial [Bryobacteraceae bacterium]|nr:GNAT family N-acetyltransferase [Bryobacteraceae bacterium]